MASGGPATDPLPLGSHLLFEEVQIGFQNLGCELLEGGDVIQNPNAPSVGGRNEVPFPGMDHQVVNAHRGQALTHLFPIGAPVHGEEDSELRAGKEQIRVLGIFPHHVNGIPVRDSFGDPDP